MKSKSKDPINPRTAKKVSLRRTLKETKKITKNVEHARKELISINEVLNQRINVNTTVKAVKETITRNENVEHKVARAAEDLYQVNIELSKKIDEQVIISSELADTKTDLDNVRGDLSKSQAKEEETQEIALHDALTGLPNRVLYEQHLAQGLVQAKRHGWGLAVLFFDIDNFKSINDSYGHDVGDKVLLLVANRLRSLIREEDTVSRWGGDEFICLLLEVKQEADVARLAVKVVNQIAVDFEFNGIVISIRASVGIAIYPSDGETADILFKNADIAMFKAKGTEKRVLTFRQSARFKTARQTNV